MRPRWPGFARADPQRGAAALTSRAEGPRDPQRMQSKRQEPVFFSQRSQMELVLIKLWNP